MNTPDSVPSKIDYGSVIEYKKKLLRNAFDNFKNDSNGLDKKFNNFCKAHEEWLNDFALFMACKEAHNGAVWSQWDEELVHRKKSSIKEWSNKLSDDILYQKFVQFIFFKQWKTLQDYANKKGVKIIGDMPIFIAYDSSDLWADKGEFTVDEDGRLKFVAGVPPDYFSATGQLWGNPLYKWNVMEKNNFAWWKRRFASLLELVEIIRIDHFRGFEAYWRIPGDAKIAETGNWLKAPGEELFKAVRKHLGDLPILAEDLGVITPEVEELRDKFGFPGMKVLQFAFGDGMESKFLPHNYIPNCVVYTDTHDNDTTRGFFEKEKENNGDIFEHAQKYVNYSGEDMVTELIRTAYASVANFVIIPMQDILNLGSEARMNFPSTLGENWSWRFTWEQMDDNLSKYLKELTELYERPPKKKLSNEV